MGSRADTRTTGLGSVADTLTRPRDPKARKTSTHPALIPAIIGAVAAMVAVFGMAGWVSLVGKFAVVVAIQAVGFWGFTALGYRPFSVVGWKVTYPPFVALILLAGWVHTDVDDPDNTLQFVIVALATMAILPVLGFLIGPPAPPSVQEPEWFVIFMLVVAFLILFAVAWFNADPQCDLRTSDVCTIPW
ncbi:hypothetical protein ACFVAJ_17170 [Agromyces sp. NPDC057679]|uniref:hypothetical protein n=1 Tax=Agromyces sp. NPDC057679 TaxID=3346207 RepID=UPI00366C7201